MTYRQLLEKLSNLTEEQLNAEVIYVTESDFIPIDSIDEAILPIIFEDGVSRVGPWEEAEKKFPEEREFECMMEMSDTHPEGTLTLSDGTEKTGSKIR